MPSSPVLGVKFDSIEEALCGILKDSPGGSRAPFRPVKRQQISTPSSPVLDHCGRSPPLRTKPQIEPAAAHQIRAMVTPAAKVARKIPLTGLDNAPTPRAPLSQKPSTGAFDVAGETGSAASSVRLGAGKDNVLVAVRVRPSVPVGYSALTLAQQRAAASSAHDDAWRADAEYGTVTPADGQGSGYRFDAVCTSSSNVDIYQTAAKRLVVSTMEGYDAAVFSYGQTASGKTFTLSGTPQNPGIIPLAVSDVFRYIRSHPDREYLLRASFLELYNEQLKDLLAPETEGQIKIRQDADKRFFVSPLHEEIVTNESQVAELLKRGDRARHTASTDYNARSSRSHTVFSMVVESRAAVSHDMRAGRRISRGHGLKGGAMLDDGHGGPVTVSRLSLIDLAGSEKATSQADRRIEGAFINKSLLTLEKVIAALTEEKTKAHVPYRDSKLTQLLQPSLSGEARVAVVCCINPCASSVEESKSTLKFASRVKKVTLHAEKRQVVDDKALLNQYRQQIARLEAELAAKNAEGHPGVPPTPRSTSDETLRRKREQEKVEHDNQVKTLQTKIATFQELLLTSKNLDSKRQVAPIRHVSLEKPKVRESKDELHEKLLDLQDKLAEAEDTISRLFVELRAVHKELGERPPAPKDSTPAGKDQLISQLTRQRQELEIVLSEQERETKLEIARIKRNVEREWADKVDGLRGELEAKQAIEYDLRETLDLERKRAHRLECYSVNVLKKETDALTRPRHSSMDTQGRFYSIEGDDILLPSIADEALDLELMSSSFVTSPDLLGQSTVLRTSVPRRRIP